MIPNNVKKFLLERKSSFYEDCLIDDGTNILITSDDYDFFKKEYGLNHKSSFTEFFSVIGSPPIGKGSELHGLIEIDEQIEYDLDDEELPEGVGTRFIRFTSSAYSHSYFFDTVTDAVYDVEWGQEQDMVDGKITPMFANFSDFLTWYYS